VDVERVSERWEVLLYRDLEAVEYYPQYFGNVPI
jgi:hypothetical protein